MKNDEVSYSLGFLDQLAIVRVDVGLVEVPVGEVIEQVKQTTRDQVDAGGFQWLQKARRKTQCDTIAMPIELAPASHEAQKTRLGQGLAATRSGEQILQCLVVRAMSTGVNVTVSHSVL